ncbi:MAG: GNAT family N-acetyltransferase [Anaerolineae bacterium]|nr:GNAT family N-acetyltransferase [Anaerolineae bacterium]
MITEIPVDLPERIEAQRLYLRPYRAGDGAWYYAMSLRNREHLLPYEAGNPALSLESEEAAEALMRELAADWAQGNAFFMGAFRRQGDVFLAQIYVGPVNWDLPEFVVGYFVDIAHQGQGYVSEAVRAALGFVFRDLGARRVSLRCDERNARSIRVAERCGMLREGHLRENKRYPDGSVSGTYLYGLLRREWEGR